MSWYKITLPFSECGIDGSGKALQTAFEVIFMACGAPRDAALFTNHAKDFKFCFYYFSPRAAGIASLLIKSHNAVECSPPIRDGTSLLVGHSDALESLPTQ
jgi:hypothetical protein